MDSKTFILTFCVVLAVINFRPTAAVDTAAYTEYKDALAEKTTIEEKLTYLNETGTAQTTTFVLEKSAAIYRLIGEFLAENTTGITAEQRKELNKIYLNLRQAAVTNYVTNVLDALNDQERPLSNDTKAVVHDLILNYANELNIAYKIFENAIDQLYTLKTPLYLSEFFRSSEAKNNEIDTVLFNVQMYLFNKYNQYDIDDEYSLYIAHYFYEATTSQTANLTNIERRKLNRAIYALPSKLETLFYSTEVCLASEYGYMYEYAGEASDVSRRHVYITYQYRKISTRIFNITFSRSMTTIQGRLRSETSKRYLYRGSDDIIYANSSPNRIPTNSLWSLSFNVDKIRFHQDDYYLCGSEKLGNDNRLIVEAAEYSSAEVPSECEWSIVECSYN